MYLHYFYLHLEWWIEKIIWRSHSSLWRWLWFNGGKLTPQTEGKNIKSLDVLLFKSRDCWPCFVLRSSVSMYSALPLPRQPILKRRIATRGIIVLYLNVIVLNERYIQDSILRYHLIFNTRPKNTNLELSNN